MMVSRDPSGHPDFAHSIHARLQIAPQVRKVVGAAGIAATHPDYSDCSTRTGCHIGTPFTQLRLEIVHSCYSAPHLRWRLPDTNPNWPFLAEQSIIDLSSKNLNMDRSEVGQKLRGGREEEAHY